MQSETVCTSSLLGDFFEQTMAKHSEKPAYRCGQHTVTFSEMEISSRQFANWLQTLPGLSQGDRVAVQLPNIIQYPITAYGVLRAGMVLVNTNPLYTPREMQHQFVDSQTKVVVLLRSKLSDLASFIADTQIEHVVVVDPGDLLSEPERVEESNQVLLHSILATQPKESVLAPVNQHKDDVAIIQYTGGTTGVSKGASLSHNNVLSNVVQVADRIKTGCRVGKEVFISPLPLYHIYAFTVNMTLMFGLGNLNVLIPNPRDIPGFIESIKDIPFTGMAGINTLFVGLCNQQAFRDLDFSHLRLTTSGGTALTQDAASLWKKVTGCTITEGYGLSETSPVLTFNEPGNEEIGTIGKPLEDTLIDIRDLEGNSVEEGQEGEMVAKGPQVMLGYWGREEATKDAFTKDGYFRTGDVAVKLPDGKYKIVDRIKDMIIVSGFNVYPNEVESVLCSHDAVLEAAVVGKPSDKTQEAVWAYVTVKHDISPDALRSFCREQLTGYKVPEQVVILEQLPKSSVGKILRRSLRDQ
ncbi:long-chain fatty acid--CoA ligase [Alteromonas sediminis]|uniref:Long-chain-fatty-acid--CoA ligase n=1 Tax=Alteromonas sediminis TaxID=2259342 RepID=A0A3N5XZ84_9ALTE|nr:AMP-binding protein [Alteromonas sediminis]RPJ65366.1 long-chain fatty acid--CoA ligase [Alteromonas sediminis]